MSAIALKWVSETKTGSPSAKHLLLFMATHNFAGNKNFFSIRTLCEQLELSERSVQTALNLLIEQSLIIKEQRYKKDGGQTTNCYELNIPETYAEDYFKTYVAPPAAAAPIIIILITILIKQRARALKSGRLSLKIFNLISQPKHYSLKQPSAVE